MRCLKLYVGFPKTALKVIHYINVTLCAEREGLHLMCGPAHRAACIIIIYSLFAIAWNGIKYNDSILTRSVKDKDK